MKITLKIWRQKMLKTKDGLWNISWIMFPLK